MILPVLIAGIAAYLIGSIPFGYIVARANGVNIFEVGSKNPGATNVRRSVGKGAGAIVLALDICKGALGVGLPVLLSWILRPMAGGGSAGWECPFSGIELFGVDDLVAMQVAGLAGATLGHSFSCFTKFHGGKGVATGAGGFLVLVPLAGLVAAAVWVLAFYSLRYVSLASILGALSVPFTVWLSGEPPLLIAVGAAVGSFVILRHRANIRRLFNGTEQRFSRKPPADNPPAS